MLERYEDVREIVADAHQNGRRLRFWNTPDAPSFWDVPWGAKVDLIGGLRGTPTSFSPDGAHRRTRGAPSMFRWRCPPGSGGYTCVTSAPTASTRIHS